MRFGKLCGMAEHFRFGLVLDKKNNQTKIIFFQVFESNRTENRFEPTMFGSVRFGFFPFQTNLN
jgi:hypothetical protein